MRLYSREEWALIPWPNTEDGKRLRAFFEPMFKYEVKNFVANVKTQIYMLHIDNLFVPLTVNEKEYRNSYVCSIYSFLLYAEEEIKRHRRHLLLVLLFPFLTVLKLCFCWSKINKLVVANNFLFSTNLYRSISDFQVERICQFLQIQFPCHAITFRSLNSYTVEKLGNILSELGCDFITTRSVYIFDPDLYPNLPSKKRWIFQKDKKLLEQDDIQILQHNDFHIRDAFEIKRLYDLLYLEKYSYFNPAFTAQFFEQAIQDNIITFTGILYKNRLAGVIGFYKINRVIATPIVGYDTKLPEKLGLYRMLTARIIDEALSTKTIFHMSAGVGHFKRQRGAFQELESMAVFCNHLPIYRRIVWKTLKIFLNKIGAPILKKHKL